VKKLRNIEYCLTFKVPRAVTLRIQGYDAVQSGKGLPTFGMSVMSPLCL
jgi:hypothetical protein